MVLCGNPPGTLHSTRKSFYRSVYDLTTLSMIMRQKDFQFLYVFTCVLLQYRLLMKCISACLPYPPPLYPQLACAALQAVVAAAMHTVPPLRLSLLRWRDGAQQDCSSGQGDAPTRRYGCALGLIPASHQPFSSYSWNSKAHWMFQISMRCDGMGNHIDEYRFCLHWELRCSQMI